MLFTYLFVYCSGRLLQKEWLWVEQPPVDGVARRIRRSAKKRGGVNGGINEPSSIATPMARSKCDTCGSQLHMTENCMSLNTTNMQVSGNSKCNVIYILAPFGRLEPGKNQKLF